MRSLKLNFGGPDNVSVAWDKEVSGLSSAAQKAGVAVMTRFGSDHFLPTRGTRVAQSLFSYGIFDLLSMQHTLNFGALKARRDIQSFETSDFPSSDRVKAVKMILIDVKDNVARVGVSVTNQNDLSTREILEIR